MSAQQPEPDVAHVIMDYHRAAQIVMEQYGDQGEGEILHHIANMVDRDDHEGAQLWLYVLAAYEELQRTRLGMTVPH